MIPYASPGAAAAPFEQTTPDPSTVAATAPIRLLQFLAYLAIGGTERQVLNLTEGLDRARYSVRLGCFGRFDDQIANELSRAPVEMYRIKKLYGLRAFKEELRLAANLKAQRIDIVHAYNFYANVFAVPAARLAHVPVVLASIRDTGGYLTPKKRRVNKMVCRLADRVVVNAEVIKAGLVEEGYAPERIVVIPNGIHCPPLRPATAKKALRARLGVPGDGPLVGLVARIARPKGIEYFVEAAAAVLAHVPDARFIIVGDTRVDSEYREQLKRLRCRLGLEGRVLFAGFQSDIPDVLAMLTVSVLPSIGGEGLSNSLLESMAAAVPVVATDVGGNPEVVLDGVTGLLVPPKDSTALAQAICRLLESPGLAVTMGQAGRRRVFDCFSNERMIDRTQRLYEGLLEQARRRSHPLASIQ